MYNFQPQRNDYSQGDELMIADVVQRAQNIIFILLEAT